MQAGGSPLAAADAGAALPMPPPASQLSRALSDIVRGARSVRLWASLGWQDIRLRYRRSKLGPFWLTISMGMLVGLLGTLYGMLFQADIARYLPYLALGFVFWTMISGLISDACGIFVNAQGIIKQIEMPLSVHVFRMVWRSLIILAHNMAIFLAVAVLLGIWPGWAGLLAVPGLALLCLNGIWVGLLLGLVAARFRDVPPIVESLMRIGFFVTPVIWMPEFLPERVALLDWNPFYHFLEVVRTPLLGQTPPPLAWLVVAGVTLGGWAATLGMYCQFRRRIAYWV